MPYRYYSTQRPVMPGGYPKGAVVVGIENFDCRQYVEEIKANAWGYIEYREPISDFDIGDYELRAAPVLSGGEKSKEVD